MRLNRALFTVALTLGGIFFLSGSANAASTFQMPNPSDFTVGNSVHLLVSRIGLGNGLDAYRSSVRVYLPPTSGGSGTVRIYHYGHCTGSGIDSNVFAPTQYVAYRVDANDNTLWGNVVGSAINVTSPDTADCSSFRDYQLSGLTQNQTPGGYFGYYVAEFYAVHTGTQGGVNGFKLEVLGANNLIGFSKNSTNKFAMQDRQSSDTTVSDFRLTFAPDCTLSSPLSVNLEWFDDDWGGLQTNSNFTTDLVEYAPDGSVSNTVTIAPRNGNNQPGSFAITVRPGHKYAWTWRNVVKTNGIQFRLPYDAINYDLPCPNSGTGYTGADLSDCTSIRGWAANGANPSETVQVLVYIRLADNSTGLYTSPITNASASSPSGSVSGNHGFSITVPANMKSATQPTIYTIVGEPFTTNQYNIATTQSLGNCLSGGGGGSSGCFYGYYGWGFSPSNATDVWVGGTVYMHTGGGGGGSGIGQFGSIAVTAVSGTNQTRVNAAGTFRRTNGTTYTVWQGLATYGPCRWNYYATGSVSPSSSYMKPGSTINVNATVINSGWGGGPSYLLTIRPTLGAGNLTSGSRNYSGAPLSGFSTPGGGATSRSHSGTWTLNQNAVHGQSVCFEAVLSPLSGPSYPSVSVSSYGPTSRSLGCISIFNLRFDLNDTIPISMTPNNLYPGDLVDASYNVINNDLNEMLSRSLGAQGGPAYNISYNLSVSGTGGANPTLVSSTTPSSTIAWNSTGVTGTARIRIANTAQPGDEVCLQVFAQPEWGYSINNAALAEASGGVTSRYCEKVGESPYIEVINADVWAGGDWDPAREGSSWCPVDPTESYIRTIRRGPIGSFATYAVTALDTIAGFGSTPASRSTPPVLDYLTFRNVGGPDGYYSSQGRCVVDYYEYLKKDTSAGTGVSAFAGNVNFDGQQFASGNITIGTTTITAGTQSVLVVDGDVTINGDVTYENYSVNNVDGVPFLMIVASGNININDNVRTVDGLYVAKGYIDSCSNPRLPDGSASERLSTLVCPLQLTVNGMWIAQDIQFRRTYSGVVRNSSNQQFQGAELFRFSPELYIAPVELITDYQRNFETGQIRDLPPVFAD